MMNLNSVNKSDNSTHGYVVTCSMSIRPHDTVNAPPPTPYTLDIDIDDSGGNNSCSLSDVAECSIILDKNTPPPRNFYLIVIPFTRQEKLGYLASRIHHPL